MSPATGGMLEIEPHARGSVVRVKAHPGAKRDAVTGVLAGQLRVEVRAAPERGKANDALTRVIADHLGLNRSSLFVLTGATSRQKRVLVEGLAPAELRQRLGPG